MKALWRDLRTLRFWRHFGVHSFSFLGVAVSAIKAGELFFPSLEDFIGGAAFFVVAAGAFFYGLWRSWPRPIQEVFSAPRTSISIHEGDLLDEKGHIVVGICTTFDTETPNIISRSSLQGQAQERLFNNDEKEIDRLIADALGQRPHVSEIDKPGKRLQYEVGTTLSIRHANRLLYLLAYCEMNEQNQARATVDTIWSSLQKLWSEVSRTGNGGTLSVPVIGGGSARISSIFPAQDAIRLTALSFMFASRREKVCDELKIIVHPTDFARLDRLELQAFLSSLKPS
jgi:hypothetical protein